MKLITEVAIRDFRSIANHSLSIPAGYLPVVGANNSGKSNILRSLNLFFNDEIEPDTPLRLSTDFHNPSRRRKKEIEVDVTFELPSYFKYRKNLKSALDETLGRAFTIRKTWGFSQEQSSAAYDTTIAVRRLNQSNFEYLEGGSVLRVQQFLNLIRFRYQPNHIHPSDVLRQEQSELQTALLFRLNRAKDTKPEELTRVFKRMGEVAADLLAPISTRLSSATPHLQGIELSMPRELGDLLFSFVPNIKVAGGEQFEALQHGSGVQSYLTYLMLAFLDSRFDSKFGWQQATVWAIEEPESFLHQTLQHRLASFLEEIGSGERFQILCTTHSDVFVRYADRGVLCRLEAGKTRWTTLPSRVLSGEAARAGVSPFVHPLLFSSQKPLLLVEGETDRRYIELAYRLFERPNPWSVRDIAALDENADLKGVDGLRTYLSANRGALRVRPLDAPCVVVIDWNENPKKISSLEGELSGHLTSTVVQWMESECNPDLDQSFAGIERSLGTEVIRKAEADELVKTLRPSGAELPLSLDKTSLRKVPLAEFVEDRSSAEDLVHFRGLIDRLDACLASAANEARRIVAGDLLPDA